MFLRNVACISSDYTALWPIIATSVRTLNPTFLTLFLYLCLGIHFMTSDCDSACLSQPTIYDLIAPVILARRASYEIPHYVLSFCLLSLPVSQIDMFFSDTAIQCSSSFRVRPSFTLIQSLRCNYCYAGPYSE
jgi:hypothetical protein